MVKGWRVVVAVNCSVRVNSSCTGRRSLQRRQGHDVLGEHFLLAAEPAAHPAGDHADAVLGQIEDAGTGCAGPGTAPGWRSGP